MTKRSYNQYRVLRKLTLILAAAPLFQISQCGTGVNQVLKNFSNALPATFFSIGQGIALAPLEYVWSLFFQIPTV